MAFDREQKAAIDLAARRAADATVKRVFLTLGVDVSSANEVKEVQRDFIHLRRQRLSVEGRGKYWLIVFSTVMAVLGAALGVVAKQLLGSFLPWH